MLLFSATVKYVEVEILERYREKPARAAKKRSILWRLKTNLVRRPTLSHLPGDCLRASTGRVPCEPGNRGQDVTSQRKGEDRLGK